MYIPDRSLSAEEKVARMQDDARFDVAEGEAAALQHAALRREIHAPAALPKVPKVFLSNDCIFNCAYCGCRSSRDHKRPYTCTPRELAELSVLRARREKTGIFLSSAICKNPDHTQELMVETMRIIRREMGYRGYLHTKVMPGTDPGLIALSGQYADRLSVNIEVACSEGYTRIARNKNKRNILTPMGEIARQIREAGERGGGFATSQTTQLMAGSTGEDDHTILRLSGALYKKYALGRVYYTPYEYREPAAGYRDLSPTKTPDWRIGRLYQADRLMQLYGFTADDVAPAGAPNLSRELDPKLAWALRNLHLFPVEVNRAEYELLLRIPGIGVTYARRILQARRYCSLTHDTLRSLGIPLGRSRHFLTCRGRYTGDTCEDSGRLYELLARREPGGAAGQLRLGDAL